MGKKETVPTDDDNRSPHLLSAPVPWMLHNGPFTGPENKATSLYHFKGGGNSEKLCKLQKGKQLGTAALGLVLDPFYSEPLLSAGRTA